MDYLECSDLNSQAIRSSADSMSATRFILHKFRTIQNPNPGVAHFE